ncbi:MAG: hypothetical protein V3V62_09385 [bacterium]
MASYYNPERRKGGRTAPRLLALAAALFLFPAPAAAGCFNKAKCPELRGLSSVRVSVSLSESTAEALGLKKERVRKLAVSMLRSNLPRVRVTDAPGAAQVHVSIHGLQNVYMRGDFTGYAQGAISLEVRRFADLRPGVRVPMVLWSGTTMMSAPDGAIGANLRSALVKHISDLAEDWDRANEDAPK